MILIKRDTDKARLFGAIGLMGLAVAGVFVFSCGAEEPQRYAQAVLPSGTAVASDVAAGQTSGLISLDLRDMEIADALKFLAKKANLNIIPTNKVTGRVTLMVNDVPLQDVFDLMVRSNNLAYEKKGDIYNVMTEDEYRQYFGRLFSDKRQVKVFHLSYAIPEQVFTILENFKSSIGKVYVEPESGMVMVMDAPSRMADIEKALAAMEKKTLLRIFDLKYANAKEVAEQLKHQLDIKKVGTVRADPRTNQLIVQTFEDRMADIEKLVKGLDQKTREVLINARIIKVNLSNDTSKGVEWEGLFNLGMKGAMFYLGSTPFSVVNPVTTAGTFVSRKDQADIFRAKNSMGSYPFSGTTSNLAGSVKDTGSESLHIGTIGRNDFDVLIKYLQTIGQTKILSCPQIAVINNQEAKIHVGERQAFVTTSTTSGQTSTTVSESVTFVDVGVQLSVTPTINDDGFVTMKIKPEISSVVDTLTSASNNKIPIIDTAVADTSVMVKEGTTIMIGGLTREEEVEDYRGMPFFGRLPLLGGIFSTKTKTKIRAELLVLLTPRIITGDELTTGFDKDLGYEKANKDYQSYKPITEGSDLSSEKVDFLRYQEYPDIKTKEKEQGAEPPAAAEEQKLTFKPMRDV